MQPLAFREPKFEITFNAPTFANHFIFRSDFSGGMSSELTAVYRRIFEVPGGKRCIFKYTNKTFLLEVTLLQILGEFYHCVDKIFEPNPLTETIEG
jgi:hypothetical protein